MEGYKTLKAGQNVTFDLVTGPKGPHAANIMLAEGEIPAELPKDAEHEATGANAEAPAQAAN
jgi:CspA family cold shock protein